MCPLERNGVVENSAPLAERGGNICTSASHKDLFYAEFFHISVSRMPLLEHLEMLKFLHQSNAEKKGGGQLIQLNTLS